MSPRNRSEPTFGQLVEELQGQVDEIVERHVRRMRDHHPEWVGGDPVIEERIREYSRDSILAEYRHLGEGTLPERCPPRDAEGTRELARLGLPLDWVLTGFRVGHRCHWEAWLDLVESRVQDAGARRELLDRASTFMFDYVERLTTLLREEYERERDRVHDRQGRRRTVLVHQLVNGDELDSETLGWPLEHHHLGLLGWADGADEAMRELAAALRRPLLIVEGGMDGAWFGWASSAKPVGDDEERTLSRFKPSRGRIALGLESAGAEGFRLTNRQARRAGWVAWSTDEPLTRFADVALEALAIEDSDSARGFVAAELRELDDESNRSARLRETLRAYFEADHNAAAAAAGLGVHEQTVANRLRTVEGLLGASVGSRAAELELALRLRRCFKKPPSLQLGLQNEGYLP